MDNTPTDPVTLAQLDQARAQVDLIADLVVHLDRRLHDGGLCEARRIEIVDRWLAHRLRDQSND